MPVCLFIAPADPRAFNRVTGGEGQFPQPDEEHCAFPITISYAKDTEIFIFACGRFTIFSLLCAMLRPAHSTRQVLARLRHGALSNRAKARSTPVCVIGDVAHAAIHTKGERLGTRNATSLQRRRAGAAPAAPAAPWGLDLRRLRNRPAEHVGAGALERSARIHPPPEQQGVRPQ
jgi:hypothetical protein